MQRPYLPSSPSQNERCVGPSAAPEEFACPRLGCFVVMFAVPVMCLCVCVCVFLSVYFFFRRPLAAHGRGFFWLSDGLTRTEHSAPL